MKENFNNKENTTCINGRFWYNSHEDYAEGAASMDSKKCIVVFLTEDQAGTYDGKPLMLQDALFCPILTWCMRAWMKKGVRRFFVVCDSRYVDEVTACFPSDAVAMAGTEEDYKREIGELAHGCWVEEVHEAMLPVGSMMLSFHTVAELVRLQRAVKEEIVMFHQRTGVKVLDMENTYIDPRVTIGPGTVLLPGTIWKEGTGEDFPPGFEESWHYWNWPTLPASL